MSAPITRQRRIADDDMPILVFYRDATVRMVYVYVDDSAPWLYDGFTDNPIERFDSIVDAEKALGRFI